ncbi:hypothetical protein IE53DRAFT_92118 [Violaceomyces palustris]|uniref:Uncharacterized protein n=1 Tax=Violaceomyces palustris TaxID=1673888 RepID=A0ACD0NXK7_9BASI|nr:hypothetical protein IE53DRAFT_92118 [Violaceomyces palustris]
MAQATSSRSTNLDLLPIKSEYASPSTFNLRGADFAFDLPMERDPEAIFRPGLSSTTLGLSSQSVPKTQSTIFSSTELGSDSSHQLYTPSSVSSLYRQKDANELSPLSGDNYGYETAGQEASKRFTSSNSDTDKSQTDASCSSIYNMSAASSSPSQTSYATSNFGLIPKSSVSESFAQSDSDDRLHDSFGVPAAGSASLQSQNFLPRRTVDGSLAMADQYDGFNNRQAESSSPAQSNVGALAAQSYGNGSTESPALSHPGTPSNQQNYFHPQIPAQSMLHRASISGPVMQNYPQNPEVMAAPAPPRAHDMAAWGNASGGARPHTADGMFGQFGFPAVFSGSSSTGGTESNSSATSVTNGGYGNGNRPLTPSSSSENPIRVGGSSRFSSSTTPALPNSDIGGGKIFSYMPSVDDSSFMGFGGANGAAGLGMFGGLGGYHGGSGKKRPRRRYDEIERLYPCNWPGCTKSYGTLNHLNAHVAMQKHGAKRSPAEFKDMRKAWRKQKREEDQRRQSMQASSTEELLGGRSDLTRSNGYSSYPSHFGGLASAPSHATYATSSVGSGLMNTAPRYPINPPMLPFAFAPPSVTAYNGGSGISPHQQTSGNGAPSASVPSNGISSFPSQQQLYGQQAQTETSSSRPFTSAGGPPAFSQSGLGAYLMSHRGSI